MRQLNLLLTVTATALFAMGFMGCNASSAPTAAPSNPSQPADSGEMDHSDHSGHDHSQHADQGEKSPMETMKETLAQLPEADRVSAEKQHFCPVSGEMLGTMGLPVKVSADGQNAWICCDGCKEKFMGDPATYLAKVNKE